MKWYYILAGIFFVILGVYIFLAFIYLRFTARPKKDSLKKVLERNAYYGFGFEDYTTWKKTPFIIESNEAVIVGYKILNVKKSDVWVVFSHGFRSCMLDLVKYARLYYNYGFNCLIFDQRYFGNSTGKCCTIGYHESKDIKNIIDMLVSQEGEDIFVIVHGESMGASAALCALSHTERIKAVVADCPFADAADHYKEIIKSRSKLKIAFPLFGFVRLTARLCIKGYDFKKVSPVKAVKNSGAPILFVHGTEDTVTLRDNSIRLFNAAKNPHSAIYLAEGAPHALSIFQNGQHYDLRLRDFLNEAFNFYGKDVVLEKMQNQNTLENFYKYHQEQALPQEETLQKEEGLPQGEALKEEK